MASTLFIPGTVVRSIWLNEVDKATHNALTAVAGTNTITATGPLTSVAYVTGDRFFFIPAVTNTGATTININGLGAKNLTKYGVSALVASDLVAGTAAQIYYDGTQFQLQNPQTVNVNTTGRLINTQTFSASGTYTPTAGTTRIVVEVWAGGGGGGGAAAAGAGAIGIGAGGGAGGSSRTFITSGFAGASVTVGAAGVGVSGTAGTAGGSSSFGAFASAGGGGGGATGASAAIVLASGGAGGAGASGNILNTVGSTAETVAAANVTGAFVAGQGASSPIGGGGNGAGGVSASPATSGSSASGFSAGGGGAFTGNSGAAATGGSGRPGVVIVYEYS